MNLDVSAFYPTKKELEKWIDSIWQEAHKKKVDTQITDIDGNSDYIGMYHLGNSCRYIKYELDNNDVFYAYWQLSMSTPAPLVIHIPGYGAEISRHPEIVAQGYNVLHIQPLGYNTPKGKDTSKLKYSEHWPVLPDTILTDAKEGYKTWLMHCVIAIKWAMTQSQSLNNRISFFGTSQGGGGALLLASLFKGKGVRCAAADEPFLTNFPMANWRGAYNLAKREAYDLVDDKEAAWKSLGYIDTLNHAYRLEVPVLLTAGGADETCPHETIESLYKILPKTKSITYIDGKGHGYTREFLNLVLAWLRMYA